MVNKKISVLIALIFFAAANASAFTSWDIVEPFYDLICTVFGGFIPASLAMAMWAYAGAKWIWAQDEEEQRYLAKDIIVYVVVGLIIVIVSKALVNILFQYDVCS